MTGNIIFGRMNRILIVSSRRPGDTIQKQHVKQTVVHGGSNVMVASHGGTLEHCTKLRELCEKSNI